MAKPDRFHHLVEKSGPLWAGEAEVVRTYFDWPGRSAETDRKWLRHQCYKEFFGSGFVDPARGLIMEWGRRIMETRPLLDEGYDRHELLDLVEAFYAEYHHFCLFADIHDEIRERGAPPLTPSMLTNWPEGEALDGYRISIRENHPELARMALEFTEGGYCTLYSEGAALAGRGGIDDRIAAACQRVYDDEVGHMKRGVAAIGEADIGDADWDLLEELVLEQLRRRVRMRNGQFSNPLPEARIAAIYAGDIEPIVFDTALAA